jgi:Fur family zinc uptake transcriptional regulator
MSDQTQGPETPVGFAPHNHQDCRQTALTQAEDYCRAHGLKLTPVRRRALEILLESHRAMGAYDVLARLDQDGFGDKPPVAYRALSFLTENGFAHRIERLNAFVACAHSGQDHRPAFLICSDCGSVAEGENQASSIKAMADQSGFNIEQVVIEVIGICPICQDQPCA